MPATYEPIATTTLGSAQASITFSSIPQTYTDLVLVINAISNGNDAMIYQLNGDTNGANYKQVTSGGSGDGTSGFSFRQDLNTFGGVFSTYRNCYILNFPRYTSTATYHQMIGHGGVPRDTVRAYASTWFNTAAITSITVASFSTPSYTLSSGSIATLYGIKAA